MGFHSQTFTNYITLGEAHKPKKGLGRFPTRILHNW
jgi:hypothetical protein